MLEIAATRIGHINGTPYSGGGSKNEKIADMEHKYIKGVEVMHSSMPFVVKDQAIQKINEFNKA